MKLHRLAVIALAVFLSACASVSYFDPLAYEATVDLKYQSRYVTRNAAESFTRHREEVDSLKASAARLLKYSAARPKNDLTNDQLAQLMDTSKNLLGGYLKRWEERDSLPAMSVRSGTREIQKTFDEILNLELGKIKK